MAISATTLTAAKTVTSTTSMPWISWWSLSWTPVVIRVPKPGRAARANGPHLTARPRTGYFG